jgi:hypothetical protein
MQTINITLGNPGAFDLTPCPRNRNVIQSFTEPIDNINKHMTMMQTLFILAFLLGQV